MKRQLELFDRHLTAAIHRLPAGIRPSMRIITTTGHPVFTVGIAAAILGGGITSGDDALIRIGIVALGTIIVSSVLKLILRRSRPESDYVHTMFLRTFSFPSGHAAGSVVSYGALAFILAGIWNPFAIVLAITAIVVCCLIGISRVYLGAHYPSDVVGGWIVGGLGLIIIVVGG